jgi:RNA polymerase sigma-70 factor (ECF subfamily)
MDSDHRAAVEAAIRTACEQEEWAEAATAALRSYGPELMGYLAATLPTEHDAADAFAMFSEDLWRGLPGFRWEASLRTWAYRLARNAGSRLYRSGKRREIVALPASSEFSALAVEMRTSVMLQLRARAVDRVQQLREQLDPDDRTLLVLRVDRELSWTEIARIVSEGDEDDLDAEALARSSAALRKRFERIKARLHELAADLR